MVAKIANAINAALAPSNPNKEPKYITEFETLLPLQK